MAHFKKYGGVQYTALSHDAEEVELVSTPVFPTYDRLVERPVREGENLATVALKYRIPVSELKRLNRLQNDKEFFALSGIKIPIKPNSALEEIIQEEEQALLNAAEPSTLQRTASVTSAESLADPDMDHCVNYVSIEQMLREKTTRKEAQQFLANMQKDLARIKEKVVSDKGSLEETAAALTAPRFVPLRPPTEPLSWGRLFGGALLLLLLLPLLYFAYLFYNEE